MPVDPSLAKMLALINSAPPMSEGDVAQARLLYTQMNTTAAARGTEIPVGSIDDVTIPVGGAEQIAARIYRPLRATDGPAVEGSPTILYFHGGGFVIGDLDGYDHVARMVADRTGAVVVNVDYRLAPEHPFPAAHEDAATALQWVFESIDELGGDASRVAVAGDSAGATLSAVLAQSARKADNQLAACLLIHPAADFASDWPSRRDNAEGYLLDAETIAWFGEQFVPAELGADPADPRLSILRAAELEGIAPTVIATCEFDPLRDEGDAYAEALQEAGVEVHHHRLDGLIHHFFVLAPISPAASDAAESLLGELRAILDRR